MQQSLLLLYLATLMIIPITFTTPLQQFYPNLQTGDIQDHVPGDLELSYDSNQPAVDTSASKPVFFANNQLDWLWKSFFVPPPPPWQGTDKNIAAQFSCEASTAYCCTGRYDMERKYALQPCFYYSPVAYECQNQFNLYCCTGTSDLVGGATGCNRIGVGGV